MGNDVEPVRMACHLFVLWQHGIQQPHRLPLLRTEHLARIFAKRIHGINQKNERRKRDPMPSRQTKNHIWRMSDQGYTISEIATQLKLSRDEIIAIEANRHPQAKTDNTDYTQPTII